VSTTTQQALAWALIGWDALAIVTAVAGINNERRKPATPAVVAFIVLIHIAWIVAIFAVWVR